MERKPMADEDRWEPCTATFAQVNARIRADEDLILKEHRRQTELAAIAAPVPTDPTIANIMRGRVGGAQ
jgi:hypothetical protein